jgi:Holliday junction resolvase RusA-like endonuclease
MGAKWRKHQTEPTKYRSEATGKYLNEAAGYGSETMHRIKLSSQLTLKLTAATGSLTIKLGL